MLFEPQNILILIFKSLYTKFEKNTSFLYAILLVENIYGKGSVQSIIPLKNDGSIRLTVAKYYLPSGKSISEIGVSPDILIEETEDNFVIFTAEIFDCS